MGFLGGLTVDDHITVSIKKLATQAFSKQTRADQTICMRKERGMRFTGGFTERAYREKSINQQNISKAQPISASQPHYRH